MKKKFSKKKHVLLFFPQGINLPNKLCHQIACFYRWVRNSIFSVDWTHVLKLLLDPYFFLRHTSTLCEVTFVPLVEFRKKK